MEPVILKSFTNYVDAHIALGRLQAEGIRVWLRNENTSTVMPIWNNAIGGIQLVTDQRQGKEAMRILKEMEAERKKSIACPHCKSSNVEYINSARKPANWASAAVTVFLGDVALMPEQRYHCFDCGKEYLTPSPSPAEP